MFKEKMLKTMLKSQVYGHHDKMARTKPYQIQYSIIAFSLYS